MGKTRTRSSICCVEHPVPGPGNQKQYKCPSCEVDRASVLKPKGHGRALRSEKFFPFFDE
jgi:hypothetical protein